MYVKTFTYILFHNPCIAYSWLITAEEEDSIAEDESNFFKIRRGF